MRLIPFFATIAFLFSVSISSCNSSKAKDSAVLKFNLQKGKTYAYAMEVDVENEVQGKKMNSEMNFDYDIEVIDDKDSIKTLKGTYKGVVMKMDMGTMKVDINTDKPITDSVTDMKANPMAIMENMFHAIIGKSFIMKVDAEGKVTEISGLKEMSDAMITSMNISDEMRPGIEQVFSAQFNEQSLKQAFSPAFNIFPNKEVKVGDTWDKTLAMGGMMAAAIKTTYTVKDIREDKLTLDAKSDFEMGGNKGSQTGTLIIEHATGLVTKADIEQQITAPQKSVIKTKITGKEK